MGIVLCCIGFCQRAPRDLQASLVDCRETLPRCWNTGALCNFDSKICGSPPPEKKRKLWDQNIATFAMILSNFRLQSHLSLERMCAFSDNFRLCLQISPEWVRILTVVGKLDWQQPLHRSAENGEFWSTNNKVGCLMPTHPKFMLHMLPSLTRLCLCHMMLLWVECQPPNFLAPVKTYGARQLHVGLFLKFLVLCCGRSRASGPITLIHKLISQR